MKVLVSDTLAEEGVQIFRNAPGIEVDVHTNLTPDELKGIIGEYDGLAIRSATKVTKEIIEKADNLKVIGRAGIGLDNVDVKAATERGILVVNAPSGNVVSAAEHTIALLLAFDVAWGAVAYLLAFAIRIHVPLPFTADLLPGGRVFELYLRPQDRTPFAVRQVQRDILFAAGIDGMRRGETLDFAQFAALGNALSPFLEAAP